MTSELLKVLSVDLPAGELIVSEEGDGEDRPLWLSNGPAAPGLWSQLLSIHADTGVWPLLLHPYQLVVPGQGFRPWESGELYPRSVTSPERHSAADLLADWWMAYASSAVTVGMGASHLRDPSFFPEVAARPTPEASTAVADEYAAVYLSLHPHVRLGLVAAESGAHALAAVGWQGPLNYNNDTGKFAAVVASWQHRFGARVVAVGGGTLDLSVAAPPSSREDALAVASEHFAFCPDNVRQGSRPYTIPAYAERLVDAPAWTFWWD